MAKTRTHGASRRGVVRTGLLLIAALGCLAGCRAVRPPSARLPEGLPTTSRALSDAVALTHPGVAAFHAEIDPAALPEYRRNDRHLAFRDPGFRTHLDDWPMDPVPTLDRRRFINFSRSDSTFIFFQRPPQARRTTIPFR